MNAPHSDPTRTAPSAPSASSGGAAPAGGADAAARARELFAQRCVPCHGSSGQGDGPASASLDPKPRKYADKAWQASVNTAHIEKIVANGGPSVGKSPLMPAQADLASNSKLLYALALYIKDFGR